MSPNLRERLAGETRAEHVEIEKTLDLMRPSMTLEEYKQVLLRFELFYRNLEAFISHRKSWPSAQFYLNDRSKIPMLNSELERLEIRALQASPTWLSLESLTEAFPTSAHLWGAIYVIEGSTLGGVFLSRHFAQKFNWEDNHASFFRSYGERTGDLWQKAVAALNALGLDPEGQDHVIEGAHKTFRMIGLVHQSS